MGIRLDWEVESEKRNIRGMGEDPGGRRARRVRYIRLLFTALIGLGLVAAVVMFVVYRLWLFDESVEQNLRDTVQAEVAALRINDFTAFWAIQRSQDEQWLQQQRILFDDYQQLLRTDENAQLSGTLIDVTIEDPRARVQVQEIIDGVPYARMWFYYRYEDDTNEDGVADTWGWYHVPQDRTFWGEPDSIVTEYVTVQFNEVDRMFAQQAADRVNEWMTLACEALICDGVPSLSISVLATGVDYMDWSPSDPWHLLVRSPLVKIARADRPFDPDRQVFLADMLANRLAVAGSGGVDLVERTDGHFLQWEGVVPWLVGRFVQVNTGAYLIESVVANYGPQAVGQLLRALQPESQISVVSEVTGVPLEESNLDWRDFLSWRLNLEQRLIAEGNTDAVAQLYDTSDEFAVQQAFRRASEAPIDQPIEVGSVQRMSPTEDGRAQLLATARIGGDENAVEQQILFRLQNNVWKRAD